MKAAGGNTCAALAVALVFWSGGSVAGARGPESHARGMPGGLTKQGRLLWNFEALLAQTFGDQQVCVSSSKALRTPWNFTAGDCSPLSTYLLYRYTFTHPHGTSFHLSSRRGGALFFGNYPEAVVIRGRMVPCDAYGRRFLIDYASSAGLTLGCLSPRPAPLRVADS